MTAPGSNPHKFSAAALEFIEAVAALRPKIAVFDCDGTLWEGDAGADFFYWEIERRLVPPEVARWALPRYESYKAGEVDEETMCGEMVAMNAGISERVLEHAAEEFFSTVVEHRIFSEMQQLSCRLAATGCDVWAVSSTNVWVIRAAAKRFAILPDHVLAVSVEIENGIATEKLIEVPTDEGKAVAIRKYVPGSVDVCFGNTIHDAAMLELARHPFAIDPTEELELVAKKKGWKIYRPGPIG
ncbi:MAG TPA: haloacid dehalogenase-like hydrolase [Candidatus Angelobacter sp.]